MYVRCDSCGWLDCTGCDAVGRIPGMPPTPIERGQCRRCGNGASQNTIAWDIETVKHRSDCPNERDFCGVAQADPTNIEYRSLAQKR